MARVSGGRRGGADRYRRVRRAIREVQDFPGLRAMPRPESLTEMAYHLRLWSALPEPRPPRERNFPESEKLEIVLAARREVGAHRWPKLAAKLEVS